MPTNMNSFIRCAVIAVAVAGCVRVPPYKEQALAAGSGRLVVYRNHGITGGGPMSVIFDGRVLGDMQHGTFIEVEVAAGAHRLEMRSQPTDAFEATRVYNVPVTLESGTTYMNLDTQGGQIVLLEQPALQARQEIADDCRKGWALQGPLDALPMAGPVQQPQVQAIVIPVVAPGYAADVCRSTIDCPSGAFCKDRGDGIRLCMNNGGRGDFCASTIDCSSGLFCKNRGDGLKSCM
jgi:hypothetical protein